MAKSKLAQDKQTRSTRTIIIVTVILLIFIGGNIDDTRNTIFGYQVSADFGLSLVSILKSLGLLALISLFFGRKTLTNWALGRLALIYLSAFLFVFGLQLTSMSWGVERLQNDGYNVTGGLMMFTSGLYFGYLATVGRFANITKKNKGKQ